MDWDGLNWGVLQSICRDWNKARFNAIDPPNLYATLGKRVEQGHSDQEVITQARAEPQWNSSSAQQDEPLRDSDTAAKDKEPRTAILLRASTDREYTENDRQVIRSLITELSLRSGGEYEVFLLVRVKGDIDIWSSEESYRLVTESNIPLEFWNITVLWDTTKLQKAYPRLTPDALSDHNSHFSPVQIFMQEHREFDYVWTWELDARIIGHNYDIVTRLAAFAQKQPRKGLWERNQRYYIPLFHGDYDSTFRQTVEKAHPGDSVWGAPDIPFIQPIGPRPPVPTPEEDDYQWGVGEEADLITLSPIVKVDRDQDRSGESSGEEPPRRASITTPLRASRRLVDVMHAETLGGKHLAPETVALFHGLKAVYAPVPVYFDRAWDGAQLARWLNDGPRGGSVVRRGREVWGMGATWDFGAATPQRLYSNWLGYKDAGVGGPEWELRHGRPCLPGMVLYPVRG